MSSKSLAGLSLVLFASPIALVLASGFIQESWESSRAVRAKYASQDVRLLSAQEINRRTLAVAAAIGK